MSSSVTTNPEAIATRPQPKRKHRWKLKIVLFFAMLLAAWLVWGMAANWWDQRALGQYLAELDSRDPAWRERIYGKPLTEAQEAEHRKFAELQKLRSANSAVWGPYRQGLYEGMYQDPVAPAAKLPDEASAFLDAAHQYWLPILSAVGRMGGFPKQHRYVNPKDNYEKQINGYWGPHTSVLYVLNEGIEVEVMYHLARNDPEKALQWMSYSKDPHQGYMYSAVSLFERTLNLTTPSDAQLQRMQSLVEIKLRYLEDTLLLNVSDEWRLLHPLLMELSEANLPSRDLCQFGDTFGYIDERNPFWNSSPITSLRDYYLKLRIASLFRRPLLLTLKAHQVADQIASLQKLPPEKRWPVWKEYADGQGLVTAAWRGKEWRAQRKPTEAIPTSLYLLRAFYLHDRMVFFFDLQAQLQTTLAAIHAERFRLAHGRFPRYWSELTPKYVEKPLLDPYTGQPLRIKQMEYGIVIYSTGRDGVDEGGRNLNHNHYWFYGGKGFDTKNTNIGTRVYLPHLRRGPEYQLGEERQTVLKQNTAEMLKLMKEKQE